MSTIATLSTSDTPADTLITKFNANFSALNTDKLEASDIAWKQDTLVSWTNIKTINWVTVLGSGDLSIPTLTDGDKGDITLSSSATVWTIDNDVVTNAKMANVASATFKGRTTVGTWDPEDMTSTQATALLDIATTGLKWLMSPTDKISIGLIKKWCMVQRYADQTISPITSTFIVFDTETEDSANYYPWSWDTITIRENWLYFIRWNVQFWWIWIGASIRMEIYVNWWAAISNTITSYATDSEVSLTWSVYLFTNDLVKGVAYHTWWSGVNIKGGEWKVFLNIFK